ncbi:unnamed protein product [Candida verbasci]|uniref:SH3 domain-containing protein n=1 Tax=Candida verbasci TaxID=1227364 RepID=A0A9W4XG51_9ASCO|nr:unnamed protein product [Candida verbasci]
MSLPPLPFKVKTTVSWAGEEDGDLGFIENEIIEVFSIVDESWWSGRLRRNNAEGIFPKDYVEIIEDYRISHSTSTVNLKSTPQNKQEYRKSTTNIPAAYYLKNKKVNPLNNPNSSFDLEQDTSFDYDDRMNKSFQYQQRKTQPTRMKLTYQQQEGLLREREKEIEYFKAMQQKQNYHVKPIDEKKLHQINSQQNIPKAYNIENKTLESFPVKKTKTEQDILSEYEEIAKKRAQLEDELNKLKKLENRKSKSKESFSIDSYQSKYDSRDNLSKKISKSYITDEDESPDYDVESDDSIPPPPPPKHSTPRKQCENDEAYLRIYQQQEELKNSIKSLQSDVLNLSEISATSAGSFIRHKYDKGLQESQSRVQELTLEEEPKFDILNSVFEDKKSNQGFFKKLLRKNQEELNPIERRFQKQDEIDWATYKSDINRMNSLTSQDKHGRTKRVVREEGNLIVKPLDFISEINTNETFQNEQEELDLNEIAYSKCEAFVSNYDVSHDLNDFISDVSIKFYESPINKIRCIILHLSKFNIIEENSKISQIKPKLLDVQLKGEASIFQLNYIFKKMLDALRISSEVVLGFWKKPNEFYHNEQYVINHCWLSILINNNFRLMDIYNFKHGSVCNIKNQNEFYFLSEPLSLVSTHIPSIIDLQHVMPPIDPNIAFYLPRTYSGFYRSNLSFKNFNNALTRLKDLEIFEIELSIPNDVELFTLIKTSKITTNELSLCQIKWVNHKRVAKIKAVLPENIQIGVLQIFSGQKGLQKVFDNIHELSVVIPLYHEGVSKKTKFVQRFPTVQAQNNDLYILKPQTDKLISKQMYTFEVEQYPSNGINSSSGFMLQDFKLVIESPSGKYFKLQNNDPSKPFGVFSAQIKCQELGLYRGLVIGDSGNSWYVFAQWTSVNQVVDV